MTATYKLSLYKKDMKEVECYPSKSNINLIFENKSCTLNLFHCSQYGAETIVKLTKYIMEDTKCATLRLHCYPSNVFSVQST